jgi:predicted dehydrogenase
MSINPIKTALCSFGMSGKVFHAPFLSVNEKFILQGSWERSSKIIQQHYPGAISYDSYDALLADDEVELVIVNTPNITHYEFTKKALLAGKHVIVEKPFTVTEQEGRELIAIAQQQQQKKLSVFQSRRYDSDFLTVKDILNKKLLGNIVEAELHYDRFVEILSYKVHKETPVKGTGMLYDLGSHMIDQALQLFGMPTSVFADIRIIRQISQVDDYFEVLLYYKNLRVRVIATALAREAQGYIIHGSKGSFLKPKTNIQEEALVAGKLPVGNDWGKEDEASWGLLHTEIDGKIIRENVPSLQGNYMQYFDGIYKAIREGADVPVLPKDAVNVIKIIEAAFESYHTGKVIKL